MQFTHPLPSSASTSVIHSTPASRARVESRSGSTSRHKPPSHMSGAGALISSGIGFGAGTALGATFIGAGAGAYFDERFQRCQSPLRSS